MGVFHPRFALRGARSILHDWPIAASLFVTNRCNYQCTFCEYPTFNNDKKHELTPAEYGQVASKLAEVGVVMVAVIGGEPFVRKDLPDVVSAMSRHVLVQVTTNGWFVDGEAARRVFAAGAYMVNVSLDSSQPDVHNAGRGHPEAFARALRAVEALRDAPRQRDQLVGFESILSARNYAVVEDMVRLADRLGVHIVFQPYSGGHVEHGERGLGRIEGDPTRRFHDLKDRYACLYNNRRMIDRFTPYFRTGQVADCQAGRTIFNVDAYGHITRCEEQRRSYGSLLTLEVGEIRRALRRIQDDTCKDGCASCWLRTRGETEPLYDDDFSQFIQVAGEMFGFGLPRALPLAARLPGMRRLARASLDLAARLAS